MSRWMRSAKGWPHRAGDISGGSRERRPPREAPPVAHGARPVRGERLPCDGDPCQARFAHGVPRGAVSQHRRVLGRGDGDRPHPGGYLHPGMRVLQRWHRARRPPPGEGPGGPRAGSGRPRAGPAPPPRPDILAHNVETVPRLYPEVRPGASYERSLALLSRAHAIDPGLPLKSGLMAGFGETRDEVIGVMEDLFAAGCRWGTGGGRPPPPPTHPGAAKKLKFVGRFHTMGFRDVLVGSVEDRARFFEELRKGKEVRDPVWRFVARLVPVDEGFSFTPETFRERLSGGVDGIAGRGPPG